MSAEETARMLHIHPNTLRRWTAEGKIQRCPPFRRGEWRYRLKDVESVCQRQPRGNGLNISLPGQNDSGDKMALSGLVSSVSDSLGGGILQDACCDHLLSEDADLVIWVVNVDRPQRLTYISPSVTRVLGYSVNEMMAIEMKDAFTAASLGRLGRTMAEKMGELKQEGGHPDESVILDLELIHKSGSVVPVEVEAAYISGCDGRPGEILCIAHEITGRRGTRLQAEYGLRDEKSMASEQTTG